MSQIHDHTTCPKCGEFDWGCTEIRPGEFGEVACDNCGYVLQQ